MKQGVTCFEFLLQCQQNHPRTAASLFIFDSIIHISHNSVDYQGSTGIENNLTLSLNFRSKVRSRSLSFPFIKKYFGTF